jgi:hypothetical protein
MATCNLSGNVITGRSLLAENSTAVETKPPDYENPEWLDSRKDSGLNVPKSAVPLAFRSAVLIRLTHARLEAREIFGKYEVPEKPEKPKSERRLATDERELSYRALRAQRRKNRQCVACGTPVDELNEDCNNCISRHNQRKVKGYYERRERKEREPIELPEIALPETWGGSGMVVKREWHTFLRGG